MRIADSHNDFLTELKTKKKIQNYIDYLKNSNVKLLSCAVWTTELSRPETDIKRFSGHLNAPNNKCKLLLSVEDCYFINNSNINNLIKLHPISCSLTWNNSNSLAGGNFGRGSVTKQGREVIKIFEKNNIFIDTAHLNRKSFYKFCKITTKPIYNSHCAINAINPHKRNLTQRQIKKAVKSDGYIGLCLVGEFLGKNKITAKTVAQHLDYFVKHFGYKNIGWGTDFNGTKKLPEKISRYEDLSLVAKELRTLGYNSKVIDCLFFKNYYDFLKRNKLL